MFGDMKVSTRLALAFGVVLLLLVGVAALGVSRMARVNEGLRAITEENNVEMNHATGMRAAAFQVSISMRNMMLASDDVPLRAEDGVLHKALADFEAQADALDKKFAEVTTTSQAERDLLSSVKHQ